MDKNKVLVIYHKCDFDGLFSAAIVRKYCLEVERVSVELYGWNYEDPLPEKSFISTFSKIVAVDISFPPEVMIELKSMGNVIWIDHHDSAISSSIKFGYDDLPGIRKNGTAACELTWSFFYPGIICPKIIQYVGAYDVWNKERFPWEEETLPIQYELRVKFELKIKRLCNNFNTLITDKKAINYLIHAGKNLLEAKKIEWKAAVRNYGFPVVVAGQYKGIALITPNSGSAQFESVLSDYDIYIVVQRKTKDTYNLSMYKEPDRLPNFNCAKYVAETFGNGGGHVGACGTVLNLEQFIKLITKGEI